MTFIIKEENFLKMIQRKLAEVNLKKEQERMKQIAENRIKNPIPVYGIMPALKNREYRYDPTYILDRDAVLPCGKVLYKAGTKVNPLEMMELNRRLFFIDGRREEQISWLKKQL